MKRWIDLTLACFVIGLSMPSLGSGADAPPSLTYETRAFGPRDYPLTVFLEGTVPEFHLQLSGDLTRSEADQWEARVFDFQGHEAGPVSITADASPDRLILRPQVAGTGWFRIELATNHRGTWSPWHRRRSRAALERYDYLPFAVVPVPRSAPALPDSPFGVDAAITTVKGFSRSALVELAAQTGCRWVRERLPWIQPTPNPQTTVWEPARSVVEALDRRGFRVLEALHSAPAWTRAEDNLSFPSDLAAAYAFARNAVHTLGPAVQAWEIWNEEDIAFFAKDPPDQYSSLFKAMALGIKQARPQARVNLGPFARHPGVGGYAAVLGANRVADYADTYDFHTYAPFAGGHFDQVLSTHREVAAQLDFGAKPLWLTEVGKVYARKTGGIITEQRDAQADYLVRSYTTALARGIGPIFWFMLHPDFENSQQFGLVDSTLAPFPAYAALAVMTHELGAAVYVGHRSLKDAEALLFQDGKDAVAVILPAGPRPIEVPSIASTTEGVDLMGAALTSTQGDHSTVLITRGFPCYLRNPGWTAVQMANGRDRPAATTPSSSVGPAQLVLRFHFPSESVDNDTAKQIENWDGLASNWAPRGYVSQPGEPIKAAVEVWNFGPTAQQGVLTFRLPPGFACEPAQLPVRVPAQGQVRLRFTLHIPQGLSANRADLVICEGQFSGNLPVVTAAQWQGRHPKNSPSSLVR